MLFSWKCPFHVFSAGLATSLLLTSISTITYIYVKEWLKNYEKKRIPKELKGSNYDKELEIATKLALLAGSKMIEAFRSTDKSSVSSKGSSGIDFVTETDRNNENLIFESLRRNFPNHKLIGEESASLSNEIPEVTDESVWIVDPIDGTTNFVHRFPYSCVSIAFIVNKIPVVGVIYDPYKDELFQAVFSKGAYCNYKKMNVSQAEHINQSLVLTELGYGRESKHVERFCECLKKVLKHGAHSMRLCGSACIDLCYLASGRVDLLYSGLGGDSWKPWDYAAGVLMVTEAGGCLSQINGDTFHLHSSSIVAAATPSLKQELIDIVSSLG